ncbi:MAG TPA: sugar phosphate isomerase/epimerase [Pseudonocardiaceae bacterium]|nr:sugar phosphate isomerase/epimerase [Pseudonocardiaceae bacterium]
MPGPIPIGLSTASVWPRPVEVGFRLAADLGYDGVEVMVWMDRDSQDVHRLRRFATTHRVPVLAVHAPCLLVSQRVWSPNPRLRLRESVRVAHELGAGTVVVHPPFRWQRRYADGFADLVEELADSSGLVIAVENMYPVRLRGRVAVSAFTPSPDPTDRGHRHYTLDLSHTAAAGMDALALADRMGTGLAHVHLADGSGAPRDEHLLPGRGGQPCAELCERLRDAGFTGHVVLEVNTRHADSPAAQVRDLADALLFARSHLGNP